MDFKVVYPKVNQFSKHYIKFKKGADWMNRNFDRATQSDRRDFWLKVGKPMDKEWGEMDLQVKEVFINRKRGGFENEVSLSGL